MLSVVLSASVVSGSLADSNSPQSSSPGSSSPNSPIPQNRPSSLHVLGSKIRFSKAGRCKSTSSIPPSPLACNPAATQPPSPQCSPSSLPGLPKSLHSYHGKTLSPPTIPRQSVRPRSAEPPRSPLLNRVQSAEKLSGAYYGDKKAYSTRRHTMDGDSLSDCGGDVASGFVCVGDHARQGGFLGGQRLRSSDVVVMKKLNLSDRRDSFKKQEAVREVCYDYPNEEEEEEEMITTPSTLPSSLPRYAAAWITSGPPVETSKEKIPNRGTKLQKGVIKGQKEDGR